MSTLIQLRQAIEQYQYEPYDLLASLHQQCEEYLQATRSAPVSHTTPRAESSKKGQLNERQSIDWNKTRHMFCLYRLVA
jgi:hypothetical protein